MVSVAVVGTLALGSSAAAVAALVGCSGESYSGKSEADLHEHIDTTWRNFVAFPHYDKEIHWDVYLLYKSFFSHYSLLFVTPGYYQHFIIHLEVKDEKTEFRLDVGNLNLLSHKDKKQELKTLSLGTTEAFTAKHIIAKAHDRLINMGRYHTIFNNCQSYCTKLASEILATSICELWSEEFYKILQGIASVTTTGAVAIGTAVESVKYMQRIGPQTGSSLIKPIKDLYNEYEATTKKNV